jgi:N-acetylmuramoyl-L-alanine amidase
MRRWVMGTVALATVLVTSLTACGPSGDDPQAGPPAQPTTAAPAPSDPPATTAPPVSPSPSPSLSPSPEPSRPGTEVLRRGDAGPEIEAVQRRLLELGYWIGEVDGEFGGLTEQAVFAIQKAAGTDRDGLVGPRTREALADGVRPSARSEDGRVVEIDLDRQLLMLVDDGTVQQTLNTSTGTFEYYTHKGERYLADTPRGEWEIGWQVDAWDPGPLGRLYRPKYFHSQGIAVHGYTEVPPYPASHGCARVSLAAMDWLWDTDQLPVGTPVWVY